MSAEKQVESDSSPSDSEASDEAIANKKMFENKKWFLPQCDEIDEKHTKVIKWQNKEQYLIKDLLNKVDSTAQMYNEAAIDAKLKNQRWSRLQTLFCFCATFFAFLNASSLPSMVASESISVESIGSLLSLLIGFLSIALTAVAEVQKKGNFVVKINKYTEIRDDYMGIRLYLESESRFHKTKAVVLEAKVTRMLQELAVVYQSTSVPTEIQRRMEQIIDYTQDDVNKCNVGMGRDEIVETYSWITEAQRKVRKDKIARASGLKKADMDFIDAKVKEEMQIHVKKDRKRLTRKKSQKRIRKGGSSRNVIAPLAKFETKLSEYREKCAMQSVMSSPEKMQKLTKKFYQGISEHPVEAMEQHAAGNDGDDERYIKENESLRLNDAHSMESLKP